MEQRASIFRGIFFFFLILWARIGSAQDGHTPRSLLLQPHCGAESPCCHWFTVILVYHLHMASLPNHTFFSLSFCFLFLLSGRLRDTREPNFSVEKAYRRNSGVTGFGPARSLQLARARHTVSIVRLNAKHSNRITPSEPQWYHLTPVTTAVIHRTQMLERMQSTRNPHPLLVGLQMGTATMENSMEGPQKTKNWSTIGSSNPSTGYLPQRLENPYPKRYICTPVFIAALFTVAKTWKQPKYPKIDDWLK